MSGRRIDDMHHSHYATNQIVIVSLSGRVRYSARHLVSACRELANGIAFTWVDEQ